MSPQHLTPRLESVAEVNALSMRTAHATHALVVASKEHGCPVTVHEVMIYDGAALTSRHTAAALTAAKRADLAIYVPGWTGGGGLWMPTQRAHELASALEDRYLAEDPLT